MHMLQTQQKMAPNNMLPLTAEANWMLSNLKSFKTKTYLPDLHRTLLTLLNYKIWPICNSATQED